MSRTPAMARNSFAFLAAVFFSTVSIPWITAADAQEIRIGTWKTAQTIQPFFYAHFLQPEAKVSIFPFTNPADQKTALLAGSLDMCGATLAHAIHSASRGQPVVVVASLCGKCSALVVRKDGGIRDFSDLRGKKIGYVPGTMHEILLREVLRRNGLAPEKEVVLIRVDFFDMGTALAAGNIDAFLSGEPFPSAAVANGYGTVLAYPYFEEGIGAINAGMLVRGKTIEEKPDLVYRLVLAHARATLFLKAHPETWIRTATDFGTPLNVLEKAAHNIELTWDMDEAFVAKVRALGAKMLELGVIDTQPDYSRLFDLSFVKRVSEELNRETPNRQ